MGNVYPRTWRRKHVLTPAAAETENQVIPEKATQRAGSEKFTERAPADCSQEQMQEFQRQLDIIMTARNEAAMDEKHIFLTKGPYGSYTRRRYEINTPTMVGVGTVGVYLLVEAGRASGDLGARSKKTTKPSKRN